MELQHRLNDACGRLRVARQLAEAAGIRQQGDETALQVIHSSALRPLLHSACQLSPQCLPPASMLLSFLAVPHRILFKLQELDY